MAVILNGTSQGIDLGTPAALHLAGVPLSFYCEFKTSASAVQFIINGGRGSGANEYRCVFINSQFQAYWANTNAGNREINVGSGLNDGALHRALYTVDSAAGTCRLYVDGTEVGTTPANGGTTVNLSDIFSVGYDSTGPGLWFSGEVGHVALWGDDFNAADAADLTSGATTPDDYPSGLVAHWPLDYDARDLGPNNLDGTPVGLPDFTEDPPSSGVDGTLAGITAAATGSAAGDITVTATIAGTTEPASGTIEGDTHATGAVAGTTAPATGVVNAEAAVSGEIAGLSAAAIGSIIAGTGNSGQLAGQVAAAVASIAAELAAVAAIAGQTGPATGSVTGAIETVGGVAGTTAPATAGLVGVVGEIPIEGTLAGVTLAAVGGVTGALLVQGALAGVAAAAVGGQQGGLTLIATLAPQTDVIAHLEEQPS